MSLRAGFLALVLLATVPALGSAVLGWVQHRNHEVRESSEEALRVARLASANQDQIVEGARQLLVSLAELPEIRAASKPACGDRLRALVARFPEYANFGVVAADGWLVCSGIPSDRPVNASDRAYFRRAVETKSFSVGEYQIGRVTGKPTVNFAFPIIERGAVRSVVFAAADLAWLNRFTAGTSLPPGSSLTILDRGGLILARYPDPEQWVGKSFPGTPIAGAAGRGREGTVVAPGLDGVRFLYGFTSLASAPGESDVRVLVAIPEKAVLAEANRLFVRNVVVLAAAAALAIAVAWGGGSAFIVRPIRALLSAADRLRAGDLSARTSIVHRSGELGRLATDFDRMAEELERRDAAVRTAAELSERAFRREREAARQLRELDTMKDAFLSHTSHELRTPLTAIVGGAGTLEAHQNDMDPAVQAEILKRMSVNALRLGSLIDDLLDVDRLARGALVPRYELADVGELVRRVAGAMNLDRSVVIETGAVQAPVDVPRIERIVEELMSNASKHTPPGTTIWLRVTEQDSGVLISVEDDGPGIPDELKPLVFEPFAQGVPSHPSTPGTGIGLALVRRVAELHGGQAWVEDRPGGGTRAQVLLPTHPKESKRAS